MAVWEILNIRSSVNFVVLLKVLAYIFLIWIWYPNRDMYEFGNALENKDEQNRNLYTNLNRLLAKHEIQWELERSNFRDKLTDHSMERRKKYIKEDISSYSQLKKKGLNDLNAYKKTYKHRYSKKSGLAKIDCYCERKVFDALDNIQRFADNRQKNKKSLKRWFFKKYGVPMILFTLIPLLGAIIPTVLELRYIQNGYFPCYGYDKDWDKVKRTDHKYYNYNYTKEIDVNTWIKLEIINKIFLYASILIIAIVVIYILIKVIKYERLKAGIGKIKGKEYYHFCKSILMNRY
ncbi:Protein of unknown function, putative [Plasmodium vivax]|uniref:Variable surface protein n=1 Tax=Plasmodium vivax TaxID=5855 RepID=A0A1G4E356_PLAVI|nr:Protein of unknown function, putative [Plasmodium vivax]SCA60685.1 Protein of unknown function, putative [Plasmodium vivax]